MPSLMPPATLPQSPKRGVFDDQRSLVRGNVTLNGRAFQRYVDAFLATIEACHGPVPRFLLADCENTGGVNRARDTRAMVLATDSSMRFYARELPAGDELPVYRGRLQTGTITFNSSVSIPILDDKTETWMSLTPSEIYSQGPGIRRARGSVLIGGLGMGWFARKILDHPGVDRVTVVESRQAVLDFFGAPLRKDFGERIRLVHGDAFKACRPSAYDTVLFDIWPGCGQSADDRRWTALAKRHPNAWAW